MSLSICTLRVGSSSGRLTVTHVPMKSAAVTFVGSDVSTRAAMSCIAVPSSLYSLDLLGIGASRVSEPGHANQRLDPLGDSRACAAGGAVARVRSVKAAEPCAAADAICVILSTVVMVTFFLYSA